MKILKFIGIGLLLLVAAVLVTGLFLPSSLKLTETKTIKAEQEIVYGLVNDIKLWRSWSPWFEIDPAILIKFGNPSVGEGASFEWTSKHPKVGNGSMKITKSIPYEIISTEVNFGDNGGATGEFNFESVEGGTKVSWTFYTDFGSNVMARYFGLFFKNAISDDYRRGLFKLDSVAMITHKSEARLGEIAVVKLGSTMALLIKDSCIADHVARKFAQNDMALRQAVRDAGQELIGRPFAIWYQWDNNNCVFELGMPIKQAIMPKAPFTSRSIGGSDALRVQYFGPYKQIGLAHEAADKWLDSAKISPAGPPIELYMSDPSITPEADLQTDVYYPLN